MDTAKLARLQAAAKKQKEGGGKGLARAKVAKAPAGGAGAGDDKKLAAALKKLPVQQLTGVEEANFFKDNQRILHFSNPKVHASAPSNTYAVYGAGQEKELTELVPSIIPQLGEDAVNDLRKMAASYGSMQQQAAGGADDDDDDVPDLVESFENPNQGESKLEELE